MSLFLKTLLCYSLLLLQTQLTTAFNISHFISPKSIEIQLPPPFLQDVLRAVSLRQSWNRSDEVSVSKLDGSSAKVGSSDRYEFRIGGARETRLVFRMNDDVVHWKNMVGLEKEGDFESVVKDIGSRAVIDDFRIEGPLELLMRGDDKLSLQLPQNTSHAGLRRILIGDGIALEVKNAQEVSLFFALEPGKNESRGHKKGNQFWPFQHAWCKSSLPLHISGSATVVAYKFRNPNSHIRSKFRSRDTIDLLSEKCHFKNNFEKRRYRIESISSRIASMDKLLRSILGSKIYNNGNFGFLRANIRASNVVRFKIELERKIRKKDTLEGMLDEWRTRPSVERVWFEIVARIEGERLQPLIIKKIRPFAEADSSSRSNFMSNISFTNYPSFLVPPEDLTLGVKWFEYEGLVLTTVKGAGYAVPSFQPERATMISSFFNGTLPPRGKKPV